MNRWTEIELFVKTAELGSVSKAAEALDLSASAASRHLVSLEDRLGAKLIERNTRRLYLTDQALDYLTHCRSVLAQMKEADAAVAATTLDPTGTLTITGSLSLCMSYVAPLLPAYHKRYPRVRVSIVAANRYFDLLDSGVDVAFRTREFEPDSTLTVRRLAFTRRVLAASPAYLQARGSPEHPGELATHNLLLYVHANKPNELNFVGPGGEKVSAAAHGLLEVNDGQIARAAALAGLGILVQPRFVVHDDIVAGRLIPVLDDWSLPRLTINIAYPSKRHLPAKVRTFVDFMVEHFQRMEYERKWTE